MPSNLPPRRCCLAAPAAIHAQADVPLPQSAIDAGVAPGAIVYDLQGGTVGRILRINGSNVVVDTGINQAILAANGFSYGPNGPIIGTSKAQLDSAVETVKREADAKLGRRAGGRRGCFQPGPYPGRNDPGIRRKWKCIAGTG